MVRNILFIMCDQLRADYLSCSGHPALHTPNIDALAARGVRFTNAFVQSTMCGPSRMSAYTGRYVRSHGSTWNGVPLKLAELTLGDHLGELGIRTVVVGKTHMRADREGMARLGIDPESVIGVHVSECGFEPYERDDGLHPANSFAEETAYDRYLRDKGYAADFPWDEVANSGLAEGGDVASGWLYAHAGKPARVAAEDSETAYMTNRAMDFMREAAADGRPWCLHLSYIKPHWPYIAPAPYHAMFGPDDVLPAIRSEGERQSPHPLLKAFREERFSTVFSREGARETVIPAYMGLIRQIDDELGRLFRFMEEQGLWEDTLIAFTSDHGDYLGDHWLGEKYLFHDPSVKVPMIIADPSPEAETTRGSVSTALVEMIDLVPTFLEATGGGPVPHILEGRSLMPLLRGIEVPWRHHVFSEYDYAFDPARVRLGVPVGDARLYMVFDGRYKYIHADGFAPMLYDLLRDPQEFDDLGTDPAHADTRARLYEALARWSRSGRVRTTISDAAITRSDAAMTAYDTNIGTGILIGYWDEAERDAELAKREAFRMSRPDGDA